MAGAAREGGCRCGEVRFALTGGALITMACHCKACQRMTGGPYSLSVAVAPAGLSVTCGETRIGGVGEPPMHHHCPRCLSWLFTRPPGVPFANVRSPMLDDPSGLEPFLALHLAEAFPGAVADAPHRFERSPPPTDWPGLMAAYAARSAP